MSSHQITPPDSDNDDRRIVPKRTVRIQDPKDEVKRDNSMLSIDFSTPLAGPARSERIKQMTNGHPAFGRARNAQEILVKVQTSLRRMPGVSANEANDIVIQLQEVGRIISQETSQLVDALMNLTLDQQDIEKAVARMSIEANLSKARNDDQAQKIHDLSKELGDEKKKRELVEAELVKVVQDLQKLTQEFKTLKDKDGNTEGRNDDPRELLIKHLENVIQHLEGQVNGRRSLWAMKHSDPQSIARAIETITDACEDKEIVRQSLLNLHPDINKREVSNESAAKDGDMNGLSQVFQGMVVGSPRAPAYSQGRNASAATSRYGQLHSGIPRPASAMPQDRRMMPWGPTSPPSRFGFGNNGPAGPPNYGRNGSQRGYQQNGAYRPTAPEFFPSNMQRADPYGSRNIPTTPSAARGKFSSGRYQDTTAQGYSASNEALLAGRGSIIGPLVHVSEASVNTWRDEIAALYQAIRAFVEQHAAEPTWITPAELSKLRVWPVLVAIYQPLSEVETMSYLDYHLKDESSKSCLVTRVIIDYIVSRVWVPRAWCGMSEEMSFDLLGIEKDLDQAQGQPASFRQPILDRQAGIIDRMLNATGYERFAKVKADSFAETLYSTIQPLTNDRSHPQTAVRDLEQVVARAWSMSGKILSSRLTFDFRFPEVGSRFSCQSMMAIWPQVDALELQAKHWRVALVTTPVITCRNDTGANISAHSVALADVVCMQ